MIKSIWHIGDAPQRWLLFLLACFWLQGGLKANIFSSGFYHYVIFGTQRISRHRGQKGIRVFKPHFWLYILCTESINIYTDSFFPLGFALYLTSVDLLTKESPLKNQQNANCLHYSPSLGDP